MSSETKRKTELFDFVCYLRKHIYELADSFALEFSQEEQWRVSSLGGAVEELMTFAQETGDRALCDILNDFDYALKECGMGAPSKGKSELDRGAFRIDEYKSNQIESDEAC